MKLRNTLIVIALLALPINAFAVSPSANSASDQAKANTAGTKSDAKVQTKEEKQLETKIKASQPQYKPKNEKTLEHRSIVASTTKYLIRIADRTEDKGIGKQIEDIAKAQSQNEDEINQSIDKTEGKSKIARFFTGPDFKELKNARRAMTENQKSIKALEKILKKLGSEEDQVGIANQIIALQDEQIELRDQINDLASGFGLFGWLNKRLNRY